MKKIMTAFLALLMTVSFGTTTYAKGSTKVVAPKPADVVLTATENVNLNQLRVGQEIELEFSTLKKGSDHSVDVKITGPTTYETSLPESTIIPRLNTATGEIENYVVGTSTFKGLQAGTYTITASIRMTAGKSDTSWEGSSSITVTVINERKLSRFEAITTSSILTQNGNSANQRYKVTYDLYKVFDDGSRQIYKTYTDETFGGGAGSGTNTKTETIDFEGILYSYTITKLVQ